MTRGLLLVAHPDDETFFAGSMLCQTPRISWDVLCLTRSVLDLDDQRMDHYARALNALRGGGAQINRMTALGLDDCGPVPPWSWYNRALRAVSTETSAYDVVVTHNRFGDYGHPHPVACNSIAHSLFSNVWEFYHSLETGIGRQWCGGATQTFGACAGKTEALRCYTQELLAFEHHYPDLQRIVASGVERFTSERGFGWLA